MEAEPAPVDLPSEEVLWARSMSDEEKFLAGADLFDRACTLMAAGIRSDFPAADDDEVERILTQRLALARRLEAGS